MATKEEVLQVIKNNGPHGIGPGGLGMTMSKKAKPNAFPQAFAAYGWRLAQPLIEDGLVVAFNVNGSTRFIA